MFSSNEFYDDAIYNTFDRKKYRREKNKKPGNKRNKKNNTRNEIKRLVKKCFYFEREYEMNDESYDIMLGVLNELYSFIQSDGLIPLYAIQSYLKNIPEIKNKYSSDIEFESFCMFIFNYVNNYSNTTCIDECECNIYCPICLEDVSICKTFACGHKLCSDCMDDYIKDKLEISCPLCRNNKTKIMLLFHKDKFIHSLDISTYHNFINTVYDVYTNHLNFMCMFDVILYVGLGLGIEVKHVIDNSFKDKVIKMKFPDDEQIMIREEARWIQKEFENNF